MSEDAVIAVENVSKAYRIWETPASRLTSPLLAGIGRGLFGATSAGRAIQRRAATHYRDFWALRDVSFTLRRGEALGIIGRNGSGKSTLLQIIAGTLQPTGGSARVNGRVAALLELGSGFNPDFTGRENVFLNGAVLGLTRKEVEARYDSIAAFADIGDFIEQPVKTYSSGMLVRLAFAVATSVGADVLIIDEALSVGDVFFQQKCFERIRAILESGTALLFVSHDLAAVRNLCDTCVLLDDGVVSHAGLPEECESRYYARHSAPRTTVPIPEHQENGVPDDLKESLLHDDLVGGCRARHGDRAIEIVATRVANAGGSQQLYANMLEPLRFQVWFRANADVAEPACGLHFFDRMNNLVFGAGTPQLKVPMPPMRKGAERLITFSVEMALQPGPYTFNVAVAEPDPTNANLATFHDVCEGMGPIHISAPVSGVWPFYGIARLPMTVDIAHG